MDQITIGSLFSGIGGFELGLERAIPNSKTLWQVEQNAYCQKILKQHWKDAKIYDDVRNITKDNVERVDILCGGFPCQDLSVAGKGRGINAERSGLWWEMLRIINELQPRAAIMENVPAITIRGLGAVLGSLSEIGYNAEWCTIRASDLGAPHRRERWFCIAYPSSMSNIRWTATDSNNENNCKRDVSSERVEKGKNNWFAFIDRSSQILGHNEGRGYWEQFPTTSPICRRDDGIPNRVDRIKALGNAIVPQCSEWIGLKLLESGILD